MSANRHRNYTEDRQLLPIDLPPALTDEDEPEARTGGGWLLAIAFLAGLLVGALLA